MGSRLQTMFGLEAYWKDQIKIDNPRIETARKELARVREIINEIETRDTEILDR